MALISTPAIRKYIPVIACHKVLSPLNPYGRITMLSFRNKYCLYKSLEKKAGMSSFVYQAVFRGFGKTNTNTAMAAGARIERGTDASFSHKLSIIARHRKLTNVKREGIALLMSGRWKRAAQGRLTRRRPKLKVAPNEAMQTMRNSSTKNSAFGSCRRKYA